MSLNQDHLAIIREVHRSGGVTTAAERLHVSQSALSHAIAKLEERYQIRVWEKKGRSLQLTQAGDYLLGLAERIVPELEEAERVLLDFAQGRRGHLRIGMECHPCQKWVMQVTSPYLLQWPEVDLEIRTAFRFDGVAALQSHEIDVLVTPDPIESPDLRFEPVFGYELLLAVHEQHPLAQRKHLEPQDLVGEDLITVPVTLDRLDIFTRFLLPAHCRPRRRMQVETTGLMLQLVAARRGVSVLPDWLLQQDAVGMPIRAIKISAEGLHKSINLGCRTRDFDVSYLQGFFGLARTVAL